MEPGAEDLLVEGAAAGVRELDGEAILESTR